MTRRQPPTLVFAAGSASDARDPMLTALVPMFEARGITVVPVTLPVDANNAADAADATERAHLAALAGAATQVGTGYVVGGFSLGARVAARLCVDATQANTHERAPLGLLGFGYPFHTLTVPPTYSGRDALCATTLPVHIVQGTRDKHGTLAQVRGYPLPANVEVTWLPDGNHRFVPRAKSGRTVDELLREAVFVGCAFLERV